MNTQTDEMKAKIQRIKDEKLLKFNQAMRTIYCFQSGENPTLRQKLLAWAYVIRTEYYKRTDDSFIRSKATLLISQGYIDKKGNIDNSLLN